MTRSKLLAALTLTSAFVPQAVAQNNTVTNVHDPSPVQLNGKYYVFSTGVGLPMGVSDDLIHWKYVGRTFAAAPAWAAKEFPRARDQWAPDVTVVNGQVRMYYCVSEFGTSHSAIALATNTTLDPADPAYKWVDHGPILSTQKGDNWNAIDPAAFVDENGQHWLAAGSFWSGIKLFKVDGTTGKIVAGDQPRSIAARPRPANTAVEAAFISHRNGWYYLWTSWDQCCRGADSTYNTRIGRSKNVEGPYVDRDGKPLLQGGGTLVLEGKDNVRGPGHCAVLSVGGKDYLFHHWYDAAQRGRRTLGVRPITWDADGWPHADTMLPTVGEAAPALQRRPGSQPATQPAMP